MLFFSFELQIQEQFQILLYKNLGDSQVFIDSIWKKLKKAI